MAGSSDGPTTALREDTDVMSAPALVRSFNRYELKYVIHASQIDAITQDVLHQMAPDRHGDASGSYVISSLYFDSADLKMLSSKVIGSRYRRKLRVRMYGEDATPDAMAMVEIKQRLGRTTQKRRVVLPLRDGLRLCQGGQASTDRDDPTDRQVSEEIRALALALQLRPACTISYRRRAFVGSAFEPGLRITFDTDVWASPPRLDFCAEPPSRFLLPRDWAILEIKVDDKVPRWIVELVTRHGCQLRRVSKYCLGMIFLHALEMPVGLWPSSEELRRSAAWVVQSAGRQARAAS
jgi:SPX domain protein involved in polyphosphate accumulation